MPAATVAGLVAALAMFVPFGVFGLGMLGGGLIAVVLYRRMNPLVSLTPGTGAKLGVLSGAIGFGFFAIISAVEMAILKTGGQLRAAMLEALEQSMARASSDPQAQAMLEKLKSPEGLVVIMGLGLAFVLVTFLVLSSAGGALGAVLLRRRGSQP